MVGLGGVLDGRGGEEEDEVPEAASLSAVAFQCASGELDLVCALVQWKETGAEEGREVIRA